MSILKRRRSVWLAAAVVLPGLCLAAAAPIAPPGPSAGPVYRPPLRGAPAGRVGGGTRGATERESFSLLVLAPDHVGTTTREQPCLYWFISRPTAVPVELTVIEKRGVQPLLEQRLKVSEAGGIQRACLADWGVRLRSGVQYKWFVTLVADPEHRSKDILAGGIIERTEPPTALAERLAAVPAAQAPFVYAEEGFWYDAVDAICGLIDGSPQNAELRAQRASLLGQVGLAEAAGVETRRGAP